MKEKYGIESTKTLLSFAIDIYLHFRGKKQTKGLFNKFLKAFSSFALVSRIDEVIKSFPAIKKELSDLSEAELSELRILISEELNVKGQKTDKLIKVLLKFSFNVVKFINDVAKITGEKEEIELPSDEPETMEDVKNEFQELETLADEIEGETDDSNELPI